MLKKVGMFSKIGWFFAVEARRSGPLSAKGVAAEADGSHHHHDK